MSSRAVSKVRAFSLVELLVVMGIIAIVIALLLPSLAKARDRANRTRCLSNLRQIGQGLALYVVDNGCYPPVDPNNDPLRTSTTPIYYTELHGGLMTLRDFKGFDTTKLACPDGWASVGNSNWYDGPGLNPSGAAYMDYAYWAARFAPPANSATFDVRYRSFAWRPFDKQNKILATDVIADQSGTRSNGTVGIGNHRGKPSVVRWTDGQHHTLKNTNHLSSAGGSVLFSDGSASWFPAERFTQQVDGICYPPVDQW